MAPVTPALPPDARAAKSMLSELYRLVEALDRRVPRLERTGEAQIAQEAKDLRQRAITLIKRIEDERPKE